MSAARVVRSGARLTRDAGSAAFLMLVRHYPGPVGTRLRFAYYRRRLGSLGPGTRIDEGVHIVGPESVFIGANCWIAANAFLGAGAPSTRHRHVVARPNSDYTGGPGELHLGDDVYVGPQAYVNAHGGVQVGENTAISVGAKLFSASHHYADASGSPRMPQYAAGMRISEDEKQALLLGPVVIHPRSFVGAGAVVLPGVSIGPSTWVAAGAVLRRAVEANTVYTNG